jgi:hypothetical protein
MAEAYGEQFYYDGEVLHLASCLLRISLLRLYGSSADEYKS